MTIVTSREFRSNQSKYFAMVNRGEDVILKSRAGAFRILPVREDDTLIPKEEYIKLVQKAEAQVMAGNTTRVDSVEKLDSFLESL